MGSFLSRPADLPDEAISSALRAAFGIEVAALEFLPLGNDSGSWACRVEQAQGPARFLKVRVPAGDVRGAAVPAYLSRNGLPGVLAPSAARTGAPWIHVGRFALALYPMIDGRVAAETGLSPGQWRDLGAVLGQIHGTALTSELASLVQREPFRPVRHELIAELETLMLDPVMTDPSRDDPVAREFAACWRARQGAIRELAGRAGALGRQLERLTVPQVLCHADLHTWNVLVDSASRLWIADWDEAILAPRERDLMFVIGGIGHGLVQPGDTESFLQGYGQAAIDQRLLTYYRYAWAVQDIAACGEEIVLLPAPGEDARRAALEGFMDLFEPGNIVDLAFSADAPGLGRSLGSGGPPGPSGSPASSGSSGLSGPL